MSFKAEFYTTDLTARKCICLCAQLSKNRMKKKEEGEKANNSWRPVHCFTEASGSPLTSR